MAVDGAGHKAADGAGKLDSTVETNAVAAQPLLCCPVLGVGAATAEQSGMEVPPAAEQSKIEPKNSKARQGPCAFGCERSAKRRAGKQVWMGVPRPNPWADIDDNAVLCSKCYERGLAINRKKPVASPATQMQEARPAEEIAPPACAEATSTAQVTSGGGGGIRTSYSNGNSVGGARCVVAVVSHEISSNQNPNSCENGNSESSYANFHDTGVFESHDNDQSRGVGVKRSTAELSTSDRSKVRRKHESHGTENDSNPSCSEGNNLGLSCYQDHDRVRKCKRPGTPDLS